MNKTELDLYAQAHEMVDRGYLKEEDIETFITKKLDIINKSVDHDALTSVYSKPQ